MRSAAVLGVFLVFTSFAFGCLEDWSVAVAECLLFCGALWAGSNREFWSFPKRLRVPTIGLLVIFCVGLLQIIPIPSSWWRKAGAERVSVLEEGARAEALLRSPDYNLRPFGKGSWLRPEEGPLKTPAVSPWLPATFTPWSTGRALLALASGWCLLLLLEDASREGRSAMKAAVKTAACTAMAVAAVGIAQGETVDRTRILWLRESAHAASAFGPFVNANHGAAYVNLGFALVYYLAWRKAVKDPDRGNRMGIRALMGAFALVHLAALVVAGSVGNLLVLGFYPLVFLIRPAARRGGMVTVLAPAALLLAAVAVAAAFYTGTLTLHGRWEQYPNLNLDHWFLGNGLGSFEWRWPATVEVGTMFPSYHTHLENEYLQIFFEAGFPGLAASLGGFLWVLRLAWKGLASGGAEFLLAPAAVGEACRASVDFSFHVFPLVVCFLIVCALLSRADDNRPHHRHPETAGRPPGEKGPD